MKFVLLSILPSYSRGFQIPQGPESPGLQIQAGYGRTYHWQESCAQALDPRLCKALQPLDAATSATKINMTH